MAVLLTILIALVCVFLTLIILVQNPKGGGMGTAFGGGAPNMMGGVKKTTDFLVRATWGLAIALLVLVMSTNIGAGTTEGEEIQIENSSIEEQMEEGITVPQSVPMPDGQQ